MCHVLWMGEMGDGLQCRAAVIVSVLRGVAWCVDGYVVKRGVLPSSQTASVLLLSNDDLLRWALLVLHWRSLLVVALLRWWTTIALLLVVALVVALAIAVDASVFCPRMVLRKLWMWCGCGGSC